MRCARNPLADVDVIFPKADMYVIPENPRSAAATPAMPPMSGRAPPLAPAAPERGSTASHPLGGGGASPRVRPPRRVRPGGAQDPRPRARRAGPVPPRSVTSGRHGSGRGPGPTARRPTAPGSSRPGRHPLRPGPRPARTSQATSSRRADPAARPVASRPESRQSSYIPRYLGEDYLATLPVSRSLRWPTAWSPPCHPLPSPGSGPCRASRCNENLGGIAGTSCDTNRLRADMRQKRVAGHRAVPGGARDQPGRPNAGWTKVWPERPRLSNAEIRLFSC
jgi:hypothetical protein